MEGALRGEGTGKRPGVQSAPGGAQPGISCPPWDLDYRRLRRGPGRVLRGAGEVGLAARAVRRHLPGLADPKASSERRLQVQPSRRGRRLTRGGPAAIRPLVEVRELGTCPGRLKALSANRRIKATGRGEGKERAQELILLTRPHESGGAKTHRLNVRPPESEFSIRASKVLLFSSPKPTSRNRIRHPFHFFLKKIFFPQHCRQDVFTRLVYMPAFV